MYSSLIKNVTLPIYEWWHGSNLLKDVRGFDRSQWLSPEELRAIQWDRLKLMIDHAYRNAKYYQETFKRVGAVPDDIRTWEDYAKLPTITKETLQERLDDLIAISADRSDLVKGVTSGSSGRPTHYVQERSSNRIRKAAGRRLTKIAGYDFGQKVFYIWRDSPFSIKGDKVVHASSEPVPSETFLRRIKKVVHDRFGTENPSIRVDPTLMTEPEMSKMFRELRQFRPDVIISYVSTLYMFAQYLDAERLGGIRPRSIIVSSETLYPHQREFIERVFGCRVYNRYGLSETGIVAIECPLREGLHLNQEILHMEYIPEAGGTHQMVVTDLINFGMPLLRYETGDSGEPLNDRCRCGRGLSRIGNLSGRIIDMLPTRLGGYVNGQLFATFHWIKGVKQYQLIQKMVDQFQIRIVRDADFDEENINPILATIREKFGSSTNIRVEYLDQIPFTQGGKYKLVVSEVRRDRRKNA